MTKLNTEIKIINNIEYTKKMVDIFKNYELVYSDQYNIFNDTLDDCIFDAVLTDDEYDTITNKNCTNEQYKKIYYNGLLKNGVKRFWFDDNFFNIDFINDNAEPYFLFDVNALTFHNKKLYVNNVDDDAVIVCNNQYSYTNELTSVLINECTMFYAGIPVYDVVVLPTINKYTTELMFDYEILIKKH